ncbi:hypothetical protein [Egicoccus halophilus]|nr:hypothetical protein [Egicoccus halophilus]
MRRASRDAQVTAFYVWTCRARISEGLYELSAGQVALDTGMSEDEVLAAFDELDRLGIASYDPEAEVVLDRRALRDRPLKHGTDPRTGEVKVNRAMGPAVALFLQVAETPLKREAYRLAATHAPDFAHGIGSARPDLTFAVEDAPADGAPIPHREGDAQGDARAAPDPAESHPPGMGDAQGVHRGESSRVEPRRVESREGDTAEDSPRCSTCGDPAPVGSYDLADEPWCRWCDGSPRQVAG